MEDQDSQCECRACCTHTFRLEDGQGQGLQQLREESGEAFASAQAQGPGWEDSTILPAINLVTPVGVHFFFIQRMQKMTQQNPKKPLDVFGISGGTGKESPGHAAKCGGHDVSQAGLAAELLIKTCPTSIFSAIVVISEVNPACAEGLSDLEDP